MRIAPTFNVAYRALRRNKMRSVLTALGIIIGVAAVIAMVGIGNGAKAQVEAQIASLGQNVILIFSGSTTSSGIRTGWGGAGTLKIEDAEAIRREVPGVIGVSEEVVSTSQVAAGNQNWFTRIYGESADYLDIRQWPLADGAPFTPQDVRSANKVCVIGGTTATQIYGNDNPIGQILRIKNVPFTITGVLTPKGLSPQGVDQDDIVDHAVHQRDETRDRWDHVAQHQRANRRCRVKSQPRNSKSSRCCDNDITFGPVATTILPCATNRKSPTTATATSAVMTVLLGAIAGVSFGRRRHWHHEHHARQRDRADARDRCSHGGWCARQLTFSRSS